MSDPKWTLVDNAMRPRSPRRVGQKRKEKVGAGRVGGKSAKFPPRTITALEQKYRLDRGGLYLPDGVVDPSALKKGFAKAKTEIRSMIDEVAGLVVSGEHKVSEIELSVSFSADGKFLGFGVGGETSIKIKIVPSS
ncbi:MAG TPA: hypothetical protein VMT62_05215 [Syntrophorhabdaceae bacterium]|nr:hypothetical protein [Syntrophorhabdaceae bacterium]